MATITVSIRMFLWIMAAEDDSVGDGSIDFVGITTIVNVVVAFVGVGVSFVVVVVVGVGLSGGISSVDR